MMKKMLLVCCLMNIAFMMSGCCLKHEYVDATCTEPMKCTKCEKTEGESLGHKFVDATCEKPKTCNVCGEAEGKALEHQIENWKVSKEATLTDSGIEVAECSVCGNVIQEREYTKEPKVTSDGFNFSVEEFVEYIENISNNAISFVKGEGAQFSNNGVVYAVGLNGELDCMIAFFENADGTVKGMMGASEEKNGSLALMVSLGERIDEDFDSDDALKQVYYMGSYTSCGMNMVSGNLEEYHCIILTPEM